jgi:hypothetical protein
MLDGRGPFDRWPAAAIALVDQAAARHGGWARWTALDTVTLTLESLAGALPWAKGLGRSFTMPARATAWPHRCRVVFHDGDGGDGVFERGDVRLVRGGAVVAASIDHRRHFDLVHRLRRWQPLDAFYFFGYALANYCAQPFLLSHAEHVASGARDVTVRLPSDWPAHSRVQRFWFADDGLLVRHDYVAEVVGSWARAAHFADDYVACDGLYLPRRRRVRIRLGRWATPVTVLRVRFSEISAR